MSTLTDARDASGSNPVNSEVNSTASTALPPPHRLLLGSSPRLVRRGTSGASSSGRSQSIPYRPSSRSVAAASLTTFAMVAVTQSPRSTDAVTAGTPSSRSSSSSSPAAAATTTTPRSSSPLSLPPSVVSAAVAQSSPGGGSLRQRRRIRATSLGSYPTHADPTRASSTASRPSSGSPRWSSASSSERKIAKVDPTLYEKARGALEINDSMVYLDGPHVYACQQCRTHLTSHNDIISKSFHGRRGRAYLFDQCVNIRTGPPEDRLLITGLHSVSDIFCRRCNTLVGWTYKRAYEASQKYKEGKFIIEKINLYLDESGTYNVNPPAGERRDRWRHRSRSWGNNEEATSNSNASAHTAPLVYEYAPP